MYEVVTSWGPVALSIQDAAGALTFMAVLAPSSVQVEEARELAQSIDPNVALGTHVVDLMLQHRKWDNFDLAVVIEKLEPNSLQGEITASLLRNFDEINNANQSAINELYPSVVFNSVVSASYTRSLE